MTQEEKELLLKDLCARLPYDVIVHYDDYFDKDYPRPNEVLTTHHLSQYEKELERWNIKPYLRPMSSMTDEEISDLQKINCQFCFDKFDNFAYIGAADDGFCSVEEMDNILDYLNSKHFDYRGLIEKGLAIEASEEIYKK